MLVSKQPGVPNTSANQPNVSANQPNAIANQSNASKSNIGRVGSPRIRAHVGHVDFILFVSIHLCWVANANAISCGIQVIVVLMGEENHLV